MLTFSIQFALLMAAADWLAVWRGWKRPRWITKPGALLFLLVWFTQVGAWRGWLALFGLGLLFSLLGDVMLLLPERFFLGGLAAFLIAHMAYIAGFNFSSLPLRWEPMLAGAAVLAAAATIGWYTLRRLNFTTHNRLLAAALTMYTAVITLMLVSGMSTLFRPEWPKNAAIMCSMGALLFWISDGLLGLSHFVRSYRYARLGVIVTYHLGQVAIAAGVLSAYGKLAP